MTKPKKAKTAKTANQRLAKVKIPWNLSYHFYQLLIQRNGAIVKGWRSQKAFVAPAVGELFSVDGLTNPLPVIRVRHEYEQTGSALRMQLVQRVIVEL